MENEIISERRDATSARPVAERRRRFQRSPRKNAAAKAPRTLSTPALRNSHHMKRIIKLLPVKCTPHNPSVIQLYRGEKGAAPGSQPAPAPLAARGAAARAPQPTLASTVGAATARMVCIARIQRCVMSRSRPHWCTAADAANSGARRGDARRLVGQHSSRRPPPAARRTATRKNATLYRCGMWRQCKKRIKES